MDNAKEDVDLGARFDPWNESYLADPYPFFAEARRKASVFFSPPLDHWALTRYGDIRNVFHDPDRFSAANALAPLRPVCAAASKTLSEVGFRPVRILTDNDPPSHSRARRLASVAFTPRRVAAMEALIRKLTVRFIDERFGRGSADLIRDLAWDLPVLVLFRILGVPDEDVSRVKGGSGSRLLFLWGQPTDDEQRVLAQDTAAFWRYARELVRKRAADPQDDFTSDLVLARDGNLSAFSEDEIFSIVVILLAAGHETTTGLLGNAFRQLLIHRESWEEICRDPALIPGAIEEVLRFDSPIVTWRRTTTRAVDVGGATIPAAAKVMLLTGSANRDPDVFADPETFDIRRANAKDHLAFGHGPHFCLGAALARLEARVVLEEFTKRLPDMRLVPRQTVCFQPSATFRSPVSVLAEWGDRS